ncbi:MAG: hypothetical protein K5899_09110, partial [Bacteroidaceae bacterium]|nr:hypothetical protein [Bacteroidaceae bacterium]
MRGRLNFYNGDLTIANGLFSNVTQPLNVYGSLDPEAENYSVVTIASDAEVWADEDNAVCLFGQSLRNDGYGAVINIYGKVAVTDTPNGCAVFVSGNLGNNNSVTANSQKSPAYVYQSKNTDADEYEESVALMTESNIINIYESATVSTGYEQGAVVINGAATVNIKGGYIQGGTGVCIKRGTLNVEGGTIISRGDPVHPLTANNNGAESGGDVISISPTYAYCGQITVNISGGQFYSDYASGIYQSLKADALQSYNKVSKFNITGGTFINRQSAFDWNYYNDYVNDETIKLIDVTEYDPAKFITGGVYTEDPSAYIPEGYIVIEEEIEVPEYAAIWLYPSNAPIRRANDYRPTIAYRVVKLSDLADNFSWTMQPIEGTYKASAWEPTITVSQKIDGVLTPLTEAEWEAYGIT